MISALHLIWIVPLSVCFGMFIAALLAANDDPVIIRSTNPSNQAAPNQRGLCNNTKEV